NFLNPQSRDDFLPPCFANPFSNQRKFDIGAHKFGMALRTTASGKEQITGASKILVAAFVNDLQSVAEIKFPERGWSEAPIITKGGQFMLVLAKGHNNNQQIPGHSGKVGKRLM